MIRWGNYRIGLYPPFADAMDRTLGPLAAIYLVTCGARDHAAQLADWSKGRELVNGVWQITDASLVVTHAPLGESAHEADMPGALAADGVLQLPDGGTTYDTAEPGWQQIVTAVRASAWLHSGADFPIDTNGRVAADWPHIEWYGWAHSVNGDPSVRSKLIASGQWGTAAAQA